MSAGQANARADGLRPRLKLVVSKDDLSGDLPESGRLVADLSLAKVTKFVLQLLERFPLNLLVRRVLQTSAPLPLLLPNNVFRHV